MLFRFVSRISIGPINVLAFLFIWQLSLSSLDDHDYSDDILLLLVPKNCQFQTKNLQSFILYLQYSHIQQIQLHTYLSEKLLNKLNKN